MLFCMNLNHILYYYIENQKKNATHSLADSALGNKFPYISRFKPRPPDVRRVSPGKLGFYRGREFTEVADELVSNFIHEY